MSKLRLQVEQAVSFIQTKTKITPEVAIILGTGLGALAEEIKNKEIISYSDIPGFPISTVIGHAGQLVLGTIGNKKIVAMEGRFHSYEGYSLGEVAFPVRVMRNLGAKTLLISNAAGGMNPDFKAGDLMLITDHINFMGANPLIGVNDEALGIRFPDMSEPYNRQLLSLARTIAGEEKINIQEGVYVAVTGPCLETAAEYKFLRLMGADAVGMSTVPEVIVGVQAGFQILGISCITDECDPENLKPAKIEHILQVAAEAEPKLTRLMSEIVKKL